MCIYNMCIYIYIYIYIMYMYVYMYREKYMDMHIIINKS